MPARSQKTVKARDLPREMAERWQVAPNEVVTITVRAREQDNQALFRLIDGMAAKAKARGLAEEKLAELLSDES